MAEIEKKKLEVFLSFDVETMGDNPAHNAMVQLGIAVYTLDSDEPISKCKLNIKEVEGNHREERCMKEFWETENRPELLKKIMETAIDPEMAMWQLSELLRLWSGIYTILFWMADPAVFDWGFLKVNYESYGPEKRYPIGYKARCLDSIEHFLVEYGFIEKGFVSTLITEDEKKQYPAHDALNDAILQGKQYVRFHRHMKIWIPLHKTVREHYSTMMNTGK